MLAKITILTTLIFAVLYPLCFWIGYKDPLKNNFHKFHLGLPNVLGGVLLIFILLMDIPLPLKIAVVIWKVSLLSTSSYSWKKQSPNPFLISIPVFIGCVVFLKIQAYFIAPGWKIGFIGLLSGAILTSCMFAMNLGHYYLNVHGLSIKYLRWATLTFWALIFIRFIWNIFELLTENVLYQGDVIPVTQFIMKMDGFLILVAIFFGTLLPLFCTYFAVETIKLKNTQSTTGILYVILSAVLLGDIAYKYYLIRFLLPL